MGTLCRLDTLVRKWVALAGFRVSKSMESSLRIAATQKYEARFARYLKADNRTTEQPLEPSKPKPNNRQPIPVTLAKTSKLFAHTKNNYTFRMFAHTKINPYCLPIQKVFMGKVIPDGSNGCRLRMRQLLTF